MIWKGRKTRAENTEVEPECRNRNLRQTLERSAASAVRNNQMITTKGPSNKRIRYAESLENSNGWIFGWHARGAAGAERRAFQAAHVIDMVAVSKSMDR